MNDPIPININTHLEKSIDKFLTKRYTALQLSKADIPPLRWAIPGILPQGLAILAGKPKIGKSFLALNFAVAVSSDSFVLDSYSVHHGDCLYFALEDTPRRMRDRLSYYISAGHVTDQCHIFFEWPRSNNEGIPLLRRWLEQYPNTKLIIVDTFAKIRTPKYNSSNMYLDDYSELSPLKSLADEFNTTILLIHHFRKAESEDDLDKISGSTGITGCADTILLLDRPCVSAEAELKIFSRDMDRNDLAIQFDKNRLLWKSIGFASEHRLSGDKKILVDIMRNSGDAWSPKQLSDISSIDNNKVKKLLPELIDDGFTIKQGHGKYVAIPPQKEELSVLSELSL